MSRLTDRELIGDRAGCVDNNKNKCNDNCMYGLCKWIKECLLKLKSYEDLEEQGLLLKLPYNIANHGIVYFVDEKDLEIYQLRSDKIEISKMMISNDFYYTIDSFDFSYEDFGKMLFLTKEEAEKALKEMESAE